MAPGDFIAAEYGTTGGNSISVNIPASASAGDRLLLIVKLQADTVAGGVADWEALDENGGGSTGADGRSFLYTAVATSGGVLDPSDSVDLTFSSNTPATVVVAAFEPSEVIAFQASAPSGGADESTITTPSVPVEDTSVIVHIAGDISGVSGSTEPTAVTWTADASTTEVVDVGGTAAVQGGTARLSTILVATESVATPGASASRVHTPSRDVYGRGYSVLLGSDVLRPEVEAGSDQSIVINGSFSVTGTVTGDGGGAGGPYTPAWRIVSDTTGGAVLDDDDALGVTGTVGPDAGTVVLGFKVTDNGAVESEEDTLTITVTGAQDVARPVGDVEVAGWTPSTGSTVWETISDNSDGTYSRSSDNPAAVPMRNDLGPLTAPATGDPVVFGVRVRRNNASAATVDIAIVEGASTVIAQSLGNAIPAGSGFTEVPITLSTGEKASVSNWGNLDSVVTVSASE